MEINGLKHWVAPIVVGVLVIMIIGIGKQFLDRGTTITVLEGQVTTLKEEVKVFREGFKSIDREHKQVGENKIKIVYLEEFHKKGR